MVISVICMTYNHADYIKNALDGFLLQKCKYDYEVLIYDDASKDETQSIIKDYARHYPRLIRTILGKENQFSKGVLYQLYDMCKGKYIALCEGDDFWISSDHLQLAISYLENHSKCIMTCGNALLFDFRTGEFRRYNAYGSERELSPQEIIEEPLGGIPTATMVFRRDAIPDRDSFYAKAGIGDWTLRLKVLEGGGDIHFFDRIFSVYRYMHPASWNASTYTKFDSTYEHVWELINLLKNYNKHTNERYKPFVIARVQKHAWRVMEHLLQTSCNPLDYIADRAGDSMKRHEEYTKEMVRMCTTLSQGELSLEAVLDRIHSGLFCETDEWLFDMEKA